MMNLRAEIKNGKLIIESTTEKGSRDLDKWLNENKRLINKLINMDVVAH